MRPFNIRPIRSIRAIRMKRLVRRTRDQQLSLFSGSVRISAVEDRGEDLLRLCATGRAVAAAAGFARDHRRTQPVLGAPVGSVERGVEEEAEDGLEFGGEMGGKATRIRRRLGCRASMRAACAKPRPSSIA
jgi:hypothetical protein